MRLWPKKEKKADTAPSEPVKQEGTSTCPKCSAVLPAGARICPYCGERLKEESLSGEVPEGARSLRRSVLLLLRDIGVAGLIVLIIMGAILAYTRVWPPMVVVESRSMQHGDSVSYIGVIDTGDLVLVQAATQRRDITTYLEGRATGYKTYSNYGDVIIFKVPRSETPIIHRPIAWLEYNGSRGFNIPDLANPVLNGSWGGTYANGTPVRTPYNLDGIIWIKDSGWNGQLYLTIKIGATFMGNQASGYVTLGDNNGNNHDSYLVKQEDIYGKARGELPWFGLIKLTIAPSPTSCCPRGWGDPYAPKNSWDSLLVSLILIFAAPIITDVSFALWHKRRDKRAELAGEEPKTEPQAEERHEIPPASQSTSDKIPEVTQSDPSSKPNEQDQEKPSV